MLAKITSKNQLTLPKSITTMIEQSTGPIEYFDVQAYDYTFLRDKVRIPFFSTDFCRIVLV